MASSLESSRSTPGLSETHTSLKTKSAPTERKSVSCTIEESVSWRDSSQASIATLQRASPSVLTPYPGTPAYSRLGEEGRILSGRGWEFYNGYDVSFQPRHMSPEELLKAPRALWREAFSLKYSLRRIVRSLRRLRLGAFLMCLMMNAILLLEAPSRKRTVIVRSLCR